MNRKNLLKVVNVILGILFLNQAITVIIFSFLSRDLYEFLHVGGFLLIIAALLHIHVNWAWIRTNMLPMNI